MHMCLHTYRISTLLLTFKKYWDSNITGELLIFLTFQKRSFTNKVKSIA